MQPMQYSATCLVTTCMFATFGSTVFAQQNCKLETAFEQPNLNAASGKTTVKRLQGSNALMFVSSLNVNTDGTRRSYSVEDFWGKEKAINNLCNAMSDACKGFDEPQMRARRILTQAAANAGWPKDQLQATRIKPSIIPFDTQGKPCTTADGYLVSATALFNPSVRDVCSIDRYVDALKVSALVLPGNPKGGASGFTQNGAHKGDLVAAWLPGTEKVVFGVVGDTGPATKLGEASVAMNGRLVGKPDEGPKNRKDAVNGWVVRQAAVVVFPGSRNPAQPYITQERIDAAANRLFEQAGGLAAFAPCVR